MKTQEVVLLFFLLILLLWVPVSQGTPGDSFNEIPGPLKDWTEWALHGHGEDLCPSGTSSGDDSICAWPSGLSLELNDSGGRFFQEWGVYKRSSVPLPGDFELWPVRVSVDGVGVPVVLANGHPVIFLEPGHFFIEGFFKWEELPERMTIPGMVGIISLVMDGEKKEDLYLDKANHLHLKPKGESLEKEDLLKVKIFRLLDDRIPFHVITLIQMDVSGKSRDVLLEEVLLNGFIPLSVTSTLPYHLTGREQLTVRVRPGHWEITVASRSRIPMNGFSPARAPHGREVWSFRSRNHLRMVRLKGLSGIDPGQTGLPEPWKKYPAYLVNPGDVLSFEEIRRGDPDPAPDELHLARTLWLDFDGNGWTARDEISGKKSRGRVLVMNPPAVLGRVTVDGQDRLITKHGKEEKSGIEILKGRLRVSAESRIFTDPEEPAYSGAFSVTGWDHDFHSVKSLVHIPPGWRLLTVSGADEVTGTWVDQWTLLDFFVVLVISAAVYKMWGILPGIIALLAVGLCYHEPGFPRNVWISILASSALLGVLPRNRFRKMVKLWYAVSLLILFAAALPFLVTQLRVAVYPQLEEKWALSGHLALEETKGGQMQTAEFDETVAQEQQKMVRKKSKGPLSSLRGKPLSDHRNKAVLEVDSQALNQTGPGVPGWRWRDFRIGWNGPVKKTEKIKFWFLPPWFNGSLGFTRVLLLSLLVMIVINDGKKISRRFSKAILVFLLLMGHPDLSFSSEATLFPSDGVLKELRERITEPADCFPGCADIPNLSVVVSDLKITLAFEVHSEVQTVVPLPVLSGKRLPLRVFSDGSPAGEIPVFKDPKGQLLVLLERGIHQVVMDGLIAGEEEIRVSFPLKPHRVSFKSEGWRALGIEDNGTIQSGLRVVRKDEKREGALPDGSGLLRNSRLKDFFIFERVLSLGLDWKIRNRIIRQTRTGMPALLSIPLMEGEAVITAGVTTEGGYANISLDADRREFSWDSTLEMKEEILLESAKNSVWVETWTLESSPVWHCEYSGLPVIQSQDPQGIWRPEWRPWPGERLELRVLRPEPVPGKILTIDRCVLNHRPGKRFHESVLSLRFRSSKGGQHTVTVPEDATLRKVVINGKDVPVKLVDGRVTVPLNPGLSNVSVSWMQPSHGSFGIKTPAVLIHGSAVNIDVILQMPGSRWILWTAGPRFGPAVLFWSLVMVIVLISFALGQVSMIPMKTRHWILLGLGLTQVPVYVSLILVGWFFAFGFRQSREMPEKAYRFDLVQLGLAVLTVAAMTGLGAAISSGLLGIPDMQISGNGSRSSWLHWTLDRIDSVMPRGTVFSLNIYVFKFLMLLWSLWLAFSLIRWLKWAWAGYAHGGLWKKLRPVIKGPKKKLSAGTGGH